MTKQFSSKLKKESNIEVRPVYFRLMLPLSLAAMLLVTGFSLALVLLWQQSQKQFGVHIIKDAEKSLNISLNRKAKMINALADVLVSDRRLYKFLMERDRSELLELYLPVYRQLNKKYDITHMYFHLANRVNFLRLHKPDKYGDVINRFTMLEAQRTQKVSHGIELGPLGTFTLRVVQPVFWKGEIIGYLELGQEVEGIVDLIHKRLGIELVVTIRKTELAKEGWEEGMRMLGRSSEWDWFKQDVVMYHSFETFPFELTKYVHGEKAYRYQEFEDVQFDGRAWLLFANPLKDVAGKVVGDLLILNDITEQKKSFWTFLFITVMAAVLVNFGIFTFFSIILRRTDKGILEQQAKLAESEARNRTLLDAVNRSGTFLFVVDENYKIRYMNGSMREAFGNKRGKCCYTELVEADGPCDHCQLDEVISRQQKIEYQLILKGNRIFNATAVPYVDSDGTMCKLEVMREITENKRIEEEKAQLEERLQLARRMETVGLLAGGVAHDLNNILSGVVGYSDLILMKLPGDSEIIKPLASIQDAGKRAAAVVSDLLTLSRDAASVKEIKDLNILVQEYLGSPEYRNLKKMHSNVTFSCRFKALPSTISCSSVHIKKSIMNLVTNAAEAVSDGGSVVLCTFNKHLDAGDYHDVEVKTGEYVALEVRDNGAGISEQDIGHIFEPFYTRKTMGKSGTGLGLTVVWNTVRQHGGTIKVKSGENGTSFTIYLPLSSGTQLPDTQSFSKEDLTGNGESILVVDDEDNIRDLASQMLELFGYKIFSVNSGGAAVEWVKKRPVDLVVLDMIMEPGINGLETYKEILKIYPEQKAVIVSGFSDNDDVKELLRLGAECYVKKPFSLEQLGVAIKRALKRL